MYLRFRCGLVVLDIETFRESMVSEDSTSAAAPEVSSAAVASCSRQQRAAVCSVRHNFQNYMKWNGNTRTILCQSEYERTPPHPKQTHIEKHFCIYGNSLYGPASWKHTKADTSDIPSQQPTENRRTSPPRSMVSEHMPRRPSCVCLPEFSFSRANATGALEA